MQAMSEEYVEKPLNKLTAWVVCFSAALFFFYEFIQGNMFASISQDVMHDFGLHAKRLGYLSSIYYLSNVLFLFPAGMILDRFSTKKIIVWAMFLCIAGTFLFAVSTNYYVALFCRFITGIGSAFCFLSCIRLASRWFQPDKMALVSGLIVTMAMTGGMVAQSPLTWLVTHVGWRHAVIYDGLLGMVFLFLIMRFVIDYPHGQEAIELQHKRQLANMGFFNSVKRAYFNSQNLLAAVYTSTMNMPVAIIGAMIGSMYLQQAEGMSRDAASAIVMMLFIGTIVGGPLVGSWSDRLGRRKLPMVLGTLCSLIVVSVILFLPIHAYSLWLVLFFLLGFFTSSQVISYPLVAENSPLSLTATSVSVVSIFTMGGYVVYQNLFTYLLQSHWNNSLQGGVAFYTKSNYQFALLIIPLGFLCALLMTLFLRETHCKRRESND